MAEVEALLWERCNSQESYGTEPDEWLSVFLPDEVLRAEAIARVWQLRADVGWEAIQAAHEHRCLYCNKRAKLTMDHVVPRKHCGLDDPSNIAPACQGCNSSKGATPLGAWLQKRSPVERWQVALRWLSARPDLPLPEGMLPAK